MSQNFENLNRKEQEEVRSQIKKQREEEELKELMGEEETNAHCKKSGGSW